MYGLAPETVELFESAFTKYPDNELLHFHLGMLHLRQLNHIEKGIFHLEQAVELKEDRAFFHYYLARAYARKGQQKKALRQLERALERGYGRVEQLKKDEALDGLRKTKRYQRLMQRYSQ